MKILMMGGPYDGTRVETEVARGKLEFSMPSESGPIKHCYKLEPLSVDGGKLYYVYRHERLTLESAINSLFERYGKGPIMRLKDTGDLALMKTLDGRRR